MSIKAKSAASGYANANLYTGERGRQTLTRSPPDLLRESAQNTILAQFYNIWLFAGLLESKLILLQDLAYLRRYALTT